MEVDHGTGAAPNQTVTVTQNGGTVNIGGADQIPLSKRTYWHLALIILELAGLVGLFLFSMSGHAHGN